MHNLDCDTYKVTNTKLIKVGVSGNISLLLKVCFFVFFSNESDV